jgi:hypothetical protein
MVNQTSLYETFRSLGQQCPICEREKSNCAKTVASGANRRIAYFCFHNDQDTPNYKFSKVTSGGSLYFSKSDKGTTPSGFVKKEYSQQLDPNQFHQTYQATFSNLGLSAHHQADLASRGLSTSVALQLGFRTLPPRFMATPYSKLPGFNQDGSLVYSYPDMMLVPAFNSNRQNGSWDVVGYQIKTSVEGKKYVHASGGHSGYSSHNRQGELPTTLFFSDKESSTLWLTEGLLKPLVASVKHSINTFGTAGGNYFAPVAFRRAIQGNAITKLVIAGDVGFASNTIILGTLLKYGRLAQSLGCEVVFADWGQVNGASTLDIDELTNYDAINFVPFDSFDVASTIAPLVPQQVSKASKSDFVTKDLAATYKEEVMSLQHKYIHDKSGTGAGKSHVVSGLNIAREDGKLYYVISSPRNPTIAAHSDKFALLPGKHGGLYKSKSGRITTTSSEKSKLIADSNCKLRDVFKVLRDKHVPTDSICKQCPLAKNCSNAVGEGFGYKHQLKKAFESSYILTSSLSLPSSVCGDDVVIVDEFTSVSVTQEYTISSFELLAALVKVAPELSNTFINIQGTLDKADVNTLTHTIKEIFTPEIVAKLGEAASSEVYSFDSKAYIASAFKEMRKAFAMGKEFDLQYAVSSIPQHLLIRLHSVMEEGKYSVTKVDDKGNLTFMVINSRVRNNLNKAGTLVIQDATTSTEEIAMFLGVDTSEIKTIEYDTTQATTNNYQVTGLGKFLTNRSDAELVNAEALKESLPGYFNTDSDAVGYLDYKKFADEADTLTYFSTARGSNAFVDKKILVMFGLPLPNLGSIRNRYEALTGKATPSFQDKAFQQYYQDKINEDFLQGCGRLRANRRLGEKLTIVVVTDDDRVKLSNIQEIKSTEIIKASNTKVGKQQAYEQAVSEWYMDNDDKLTQRKLSEILGKSESAVQRWVKRNYGSWVEFISDIVQAFPTPVGDDSEGIVSTIQAMNQMDFIEFIESIKPLLPLDIYRLAKSHIHSLIH